MYARKWFQEKAYSSTTRSNISETIENTWPVGSTVRKRGLPRRAPMEKVIHTPVENRWISSGYRVTRKTGRFLSRRKKRPRVETRFPLLRGRGEERTKGRKEGRKREGRFNNFSILRESERKSNRILSLFLTPLPPPLKMVSRGGKKKKKRKGSFPCHRSYLDDERAKDASSIIDKHRPPSSSFFTGEFQSRLRAANSREFNKKTSAHTFDP